MYRLAQGLKKALCDFGALTLRSNISLSNYRETISGQTHSATFNELDTPLIVAPNAQDEGPV